MTAYSYVVTIETDTKEHADRVIGERLGYDERYDDDLGNEFDYTICDWKGLP